ncbi:MAG TPA: TIGR03663 family protein [Anaerolineae bacterium]|nr:TIGR03663 family protein [Anaerolineae bacterium]
MTAKEPQSASPKSILDSPAVIFFRLNWEKIAWIVLVLMAFILRVYDVGARTMSHDESLHTTYSYNLYNGTGFRHDPLMHGPLLFHLTALSYFIFGPSDFSARFPVVLLGTGVVAMLWWARPWLGKLGALLAALMITLSPSLLFHSRYIRHDLYAIFFALAVIILIFQYIQKGDRKFLVAMAAMLGLLYTTKEVAFIYVIILIGYLVIVLLGRLLMGNWSQKGYKWPFLALLAVGGLFLVYAMYEAIHSPVGQVARSNSLGIPVWPLAVLGGLMIATALWLMFQGFGGGQVHRWREWDVTVWVVTLSGPLFAAFFIKMFGGNPSSIDFDNPLARDTLIAIFVFVFMWALFTALGGLWAASQRQLYAYLGGLGLYYGLMLLFFTTFFTNGAGVATGLVGALGYWLSQQEVARGGQPWFYYFMLVPLYEFIPMLLSGVATIGILIRAFRGQPIDASLPDDIAAPPSVRHLWLLYLVWWIALTWGAYTWAGEKMPWLTTHFALPMSLLAGWWLAWKLKALDWRAVWNQGGLWLLLGTPLFLVVFYQVAQKRPFQGKSLEALSQTMATLIGLIVLIGLGWFLYRRMQSLGWGLSLRLALLSLLGVLGLFWVRTSFLLTYVNYDYPIEPLVYAHGTPDIKIVVNDLREISRRTVGENALAFVYDNETTWPFEWYFRDFPNKKFVGAGITREALKDAPVVLVGIENEGKARPFLGKKYYRIEYRQIWWPKETYKQLVDGVPQPDGTVLKGWSLLWSWIKDPQARKVFWDIVIYRKYQQPIADWSPADHFVMFIRKDIAAQVWDLTTLPALAEEGAISADPFEDKYLDHPAVQIVGGPGQLTTPRNMAVAEDGRIYVADTGNHRIVVFSPDGQVVNAWGSFGDQPGQFNEPWDVAVGPDGNVYVADTWNHRIQKFTPEGEFMTAWGSFVSTDGQLGQMGVFWGPRAIAFTQDGNLLVTDTGNKRVQVFTPEGEPITQFGGAGIEEGYFDEPVGIAVDAEGNIYVADTWNQRIQKFSPDFQFLKAWPVPGWEGQDILMKPYLAVDSNHWVYAADPTGWRVLVWDAQGNPKAAWGEYGAGPGQFGYLNGVAVAPDGFIWVADADNARVMKFEPIR